MALFVVVFALIASLQLCLAIPVVKRSTTSYASELGDTVATSTTILNLGKYQPRRNCKEIYDDLDSSDRVSGLYVVNPTGAKGEFIVYCDMALAGGGWTVIQRRVDSTYAFNREWKDYQAGFGKPSGNFWLGLDKIRALTKDGDMELWIGMESYEVDNPLTNPNWVPLDTWRHARFGKFLIGDETSKYILTVTDYDSTDSNVGDSFTSHTGQKFSTKDSDNDSSSGVHCAEDHEGGWWYNACHDSNLNGKYYTSKQVAPNAFDGISWESWYGNSISLKTIVMAVRPK